jgi:threonine/homoserine/homoserine lactone efflux protein
MDHYSQLWLFFAMVFGIVVLPGMDMAFVIASSMTGGRTRGFFAVAGIVFGGVCHVIAGALGLGLVLKLVPGLVNLMLLAGSAYIAWIGWSLARTSSMLLSLPATTPGSHWRTFRQAAATCLLNPKAYLFMLAVFPQFLRQEYGPIWLQACWLGAIIALTQASVYGALAYAADAFRRWTSERPSANLLLARIVGVALILCAAFTAWRGWQGLPA